MSTSAGTAKGVLGKRKHSKVEGNDLEDNHQKLLKRVKSSPTLSDQDSTEHQHSRPEIAKALSNSVGLDSIEGQETSHGREDGPSSKPPIELENSKRAFNDRHTKERPKRSESANPAVVADDCREATHIKQHRGQQPNSASAPLTHEALREFNKANNYSEKPHSMASDPNSTRSSGESKPPADPKDPRGAINAYHPGFEDGLNKRGIAFADDDDVGMPSNLDTLREAIFAARDGAEPDDQVAKDYRIALRQAVNETEVVRDALHLLFPGPDLRRDSKLCQASDLIWNRNAMIDANMTPMLTTLKPDTTIGWHKKSFEAQEAIDSLGVHACPILNKRLLAFPLVALEAKGPQGSGLVARLQSLHNGATMLSNLLHLKRKCGEESELGFFNRVHVLSLEISTESIQISCYWATRVDKEQVRYYGMMLQSWNPFMIPAFKEAHRCIRNALEWVRDQAFEWINSDLTSLVTKTTPQTPPLTDSEGSCEQRQRSIEGKTPLNTSSTDDAQSEKVKQDGRKAPPVDLEVAGQKRPRSSEETNSPKASSVADACSKKAKTQEVTPLIVDGQTTEQLINDNP